jgi:uncharacterized protein YbjT (DUF2867 family)
MKYVITGSLGHISKPITEALAKANHVVTVISSKENNRSAIEALGAIAAIGSVEDAAFINATFTGADAVYLMIPPKWTVTDWLVYQQQVADNYVAAIANNNIKYVVQLSSIGAHMRKDAGPIDGLAYLEEKLEVLKDTNTVFLRPSYFFYNLFSQIDLVKNAGIFGSNFGGDEKLVLVDTNHIAEVAIDYLLHLNFKGHSIQYIANDERTVNEIASVVGAAIDKSNTPWVTFSNEQALQGMLSSGLPETIANGYIQMGKSIHNGLLQEDYWKNKPTNLGSLKLEDFAKQFAAVYHQKNNN